MGLSYYSTVCGSKLWYIPGTSELYIHIGIISISPSHPSLRVRAFICIWNTRYPPVIRKKYPGRIKGTEGSCEGCKGIQGHQCAWPSHCAKTDDGILIKPISGNKGVCSWCA